MKIMCLSVTEITSPWTSHLLFTSNYLRHILHDFIFILTSII